MASKLAANVLEQLSERVAAHAGLKLPGWVLEARLSDRVAALGLDAPERYIELLGAPGGRRELQHLLETLRVGETRFFRHPSHVRALTDVVVPALLDKCRKGSGTGRNQVRVWSAGCASGEEPYTLSMVLRSKLSAAKADIEIIATDISKDALDTARAAVYPNAALEHVPQRWRKSAFVSAGEGRWRVSEKVRELVDFGQHNLAEGGFPRRLDVIWCRNVLIYFTPEARARTIDRMLDSLVPGGFLFVGYAETLRQFTALDMIRTPDAVLYRKAEPQAAATARVRPVAAVGASANRGATARAAPTRKAAPQAAPTRAATPVVAEEALIELCGRYDDEARLSRELGEVMGGSYRRVIVDIDGASFLDDSAAAVLRRARSAARAAGVKFEVVATRPGPQRWLRRCGLVEPERDA